MLDAAIRTARIACLCLFAAAAAAAGAHAADAAPAIPDSYARPARLVDIGAGRQLNLRCTGKGPQTVLLEAGSHADSMSWFRLQPLLAPMARVCAYDRAGYGFSSEGPLPRNLEADVADLRKLIEAAGLKGPLVLVGHSLGSNIVRRYAELHPRDVAGLVLLDPPAQDVAAFAPDWAKEDIASNAQRLAFVQQCLDGAEKGQLTTPPPALARCIAGPNPLAGAPLNASIHAQKSRPGYWRTLLSELQSNEQVFGPPVSSKETHGATPLLVLSASDTYADAPAEVRKALEAARDATQARIAASSSRGERITVQHSSHDIQLDQPEAVAQAVAKLWRQSATH